jgi:hypothetical protein
MADRDSGWAPWYHYVPVLAAGNALAQFAFLRGTGPVANAVVSIVLSAVLMLVVTLAWRATRGTRARDRGRP